MDCRRALGGPLRGRRRRRRDCGRAGPRRPDAARGACGLTVLLRLTLEYDGSEFHGWARQPGLRTVEGVLSDGLDRVFPTWSGLAVAGRTDAGVHALGQVVSLEAGGGPPLEHAAEALNAVLPGDVAVLAAAEAPPGFHARFSARSRSYRYRISRRGTPSPFEARRSWWLPQAPDEERLQVAAALLPGEHDFRAFTPTETEHEVFLRVIERAEWRRDGDGLDFEITADSFLRHMVRTLVGTMVDVEPEELAALLQGGRREQAGRTAPPHGLYLIGVAYDQEP